MRQLRAFLNRHKALIQWASIMLSLVAMTWTVSSRLSNIEARITAQEQLVHALVVLHLQK